MEQVRQMSTQVLGLPRRTQIVIGGVVLVTLLVMYLIVHAATATKWVPVGEVTPGNATEAQDTLEAKGIESRLAEGATIVEAPDHKSQEARATLAAAGISTAGGAHKTCEDKFGEKGGMIASTSAETAQKIRSCYQGEIANRVEQIEGIDRATVSLTMPEPELFSDEESPAEASITINTGAARFNDEQAEAVVATATGAGVTGLKPDNVIVIDNHGNVLTDLTAGDNEILGATLKSRMEEIYNAKREAKLTSQFEKITGEGKIAVISAAELDMDKIMREVKQFGGEDGEQGPISGETNSRETLVKGSGATGGTTGTTSNIGSTFNAVAAGSTGTHTVEDVKRTSDDDPPLDEDDEQSVTDVLVKRLVAENGQVGQPDYEKFDENVTYDNDVLGEAIDVAQGTKLADKLAITVDDSVSQETVNRIEEHARTLFGSNTPTNDSFSIARVKMASAKQRGGAGSLLPRVSDDDLVTYGKWALLGMGLIGLAFFVRRTLRQREWELLNPSEEMLALEAAGMFDPIPLKELEAAVSAASSYDNQKRIDLKRRVDAIASKQPENVAQQLRGWLYDDDRYAGRR